MTTLGDDLDRSLTDCCAWVGSRSGDDTAVVLVIFLASEGETAGRDKDDEPARTDGMLPSCTVEDGLLISSCSCDRGIEFGVMTGGDLTLAAGLCCGSSSFNFGTCPGTPP